MAYKRRGKVVIFDGVKGLAINPWDLDSNTGWTSLTGDDDPMGQDALFQRVPWLYRGAKDRANNVAHMPFSITLNDTEVDASSAYTNALEFLPQPTMLFHKLELSLVMCGRAYLGLDVNSSGYVKRVRYLVPTSISEKYDEAGQLIGYERRIHGRTYLLSPGSVVAMYDPDYMTENGPGKSSAALAALTSAGVLYAADTFIAQYFNRGAIKATILATKGTDRTEAERLQHWWDDVVGGIRNAWAALVLRGEGVTPVVIGEGLDSLQNETLTTERRQNIATALGLPESRLWSSAANYATAEQDNKNYLLSTIIPECELIAEALNEQLFNESHHLAGYQIQFLPETLDAFQVEAAAQAGALQALVSAGIPLLIAVDLVGLDLTDEQRAELEEAETPEPVPPALAPYAGQDNPPAQPEPAQEPMAEQPSPDTQNALAMWQRKAIKRLKESGSAVCDFVSEAIPQDDHDRIAATLPTCQTAADVKAAFTRPEPMDVTDQLKRALDWLEAHV